jgi:hypothetical protein
MLRYDGRLTPSTCVHIVIAFTAFWASVTLHEAKSSATGADAVVNM